jgi:hypothetical protein
VIIRLSKPRSCLEAKPVPALSSSPIVAVLDRPGLPVDEPAGLSLAEALAQVPDPRAARGARHGVLPVLLISACAVLAGARSYAAIAEYAHDSGRDVLDALQVGADAPHASTIRRVLQPRTSRTWCLATRLPCCADTTQIRG